MSIVSIGRAVNLIGALGVVALCASSASAQVSASASNAIAAKRKGLPTTLVTSHFQTPVTGNPVESELGNGAYQTFTGKSGAGAIYWSQSTGAHIIYGDLFLYFTNAGMEVKLGYPSTDPTSGNGVSYGCNADTTVFQTFSLVGTPTAGKPTPRTMYTLCANARGRVSRGQITLTGATTPSLGGTTGRDSVEDDGRHDDQIDAEESADTSARTPSSSSNSSGRSVGGASRSPSSRGGTTVLTR